MSTTTTVEMSSTAAAISTQEQLNVTNEQEQGLEFQVREFEDDSVPSVAPGDHHPIQAYGEDNVVISRTESESSSTTPETIVVKTDPNIKRVDFSDEAANLKLLSFLESRQINTNKLVQEHIMKYGSRARVAVNDDGDIVGFALFDNEIAQDLLNGASFDQINQYVETKPFIFFQLLIVDPAALSTDSSWSKRLINSVTDCIVKNGKVGIVRVDANDEKEIELYKSCGFYTMEDMGVPSYSNKKENVAVLGFTPLGLEQTAEIFKKLYGQGARF